MYVIGTAGHVDHGKSTLVAALSGMDPDRLKEEKVREMTIDLGFAWLQLDGKTEIGIVDVPGHRDFIENMLAGVGGIDAVLFVIAADEGVMAQTREHLAILDLLQIQRGVIVLTKSDLITDSDWFDLLEEDIRATMKGTILEWAPMVRVSSRSGEGLEELKQHLLSLLLDVPQKADRGRPRLPIDRAFTIAGFGSVVTGTLLDGGFALGDEVEILPSGLRGRIRTIQTHKRKVQSAPPGGRTAINITGVDIADIRRGEVLVKPGQYHLSHRLDVQFRLLKDASQPLLHNTNLKFFHGTAELAARVRLIGSEALQPGETGWLQLELEGETVLVKGDHYILRRPSPGETIGGGIVLNPNPQRKHKRFAETVTGQFETLFAGSPAELLLAALQKKEIAKLGEVATEINMPVAQALEALLELKSAGAILQLDGQDEITPNSAIMTSQRYDALIKSFASILEGYHCVYPLRAGLSREELKSKTGLPARTFSTLLERAIAKGQVIEREAALAQPGFEIRYSADQQKLVDRLMDEFKARAFQPPTLKESFEIANEEIVKSLVAQGRLVKLSEEIVFSQETYDRLLDSTISQLKDGQPVSVATIRDTFNTSRKYALPFLEHLDASGITYRDGDFRKLKKQRNFG